MNKNLYVLKEHPNYEAVYEAHFSGNRTTAYHSHEDFYEIFITLKPNLVHLFNGKQQVLEDKTLYIVSPKNRHKLVYDGGGKGFHHFNLGIDSAYFERAVNAVSAEALNIVKTGGGLLTLPLKESEFNFLYELSKELTSAPTLSQRQSVAKLILTNVSVLLELRYKKPVHGKLENYAQDLKEKIDNLEFIDKGVSEMYGEYPVSFSGLVKKFKELTGKTVVEYLSERRVEYAKILLITTDYSVLDVSSIVGYGSLSHFINVFKQLVGVSPLVYKKQNKTLY